MVSGEFGLVAGANRANLHAWRSLSLSGAGRLLVIIVIGIIGATVIGSSLVIRKT
jgi:hypothetical protein